MYISCSETGSAPLGEPETGYVPNNPLFGLPLDSPPQECPSSCNGCVGCQGGSSLPISGLHGSDFDCGNCLDHNNILSASQHNSHSNNISNGYWIEEMNTFPSLPPLDIDPLPSLFPFSPCGATYNRTERPTHDMADVLLSLKHAVLKTSPDPQQMSGQNQHSYGGHPQASLSYTVHPQMLVSPGHQSCQNQGNMYPAPGYYETPCNQHTPSIYPSMSVNVSMNMTMHSYGADAGMPMQCSQMPWSPQNAPSSVNVLYPPLLSPNHYPQAATYSFTADFRSPATAGAPAPSAIGGPMMEMPKAMSPVSPASAQRSNDNHSNNYFSPNITAFPPQRSPISSSAGHGQHQSHHHQHQHHHHQQQQQQQQEQQHQLSYENATNADEPMRMRSTSAMKTLHSAVPPPQSLPLPPLIGGVNGSGGVVSVGYDDEDSSDGMTGGDAKTNLCRLCGKTYARPSTLKTHLRTHSGERPYRCPDCNKSFSQAANLTAHVRTHTGQKPFRCLICDRRFSQSSSVTTHMRTHSGERPYRCRACKKAFSDSSTLTKHLRIHSGEKPYQCKLCLLRFSQSGNLNRHMRVHGTNGNSPMT